MTKATLWCEVCDKTYEIDYDLFEELSESKCPKCGSDKTWVQNVENDNSNFKLKGNGGCGKQSTW